jgi:hypothetical protein
LSLVQMIADELSRNYSGNLMLGSGSA